MPVIQRPLQLRSVYRDIPSGVNQTAIVIGCLGAFFAILIIILFACLHHRHKKTVSPEDVEIKRRRANAQWGNQGTPDIAVDRTAPIATEAQVSAEPPVYSVPEPTYQQNDLPPAYESTAVWPRSISNWTATLPRRPTNKWTGVWPFRSTRSA